MICRHCAKPFPCPGCCHAPRPSPPIRIPQPCWPGMDYSVLGQCDSAAAEPPSPHEEAFLVLQLVLQPHGGAGWARSSVHHPSPRGQHSRLPWGVVAVGYGAFAVAHPSGHRASYFHWLLHTDISLFQQEKTLGLKQSEEQKMRSAPCPELTRHLGRWFCALLASQLLGGGAV